MNIPVALAGIQESIQILDREVDGFSQPQLEEPNQPRGCIHHSLPLGKVRALRRILIHIGHHFPAFIAHRFVQPVQMVHAPQLLAGNAKHFAHGTIFGIRGLLQECLAGEG